MKIICSGCKKLMGEIKPFEDQSETKGKCPECIEKERVAEQERIKTKPLEDEPREVKLEHGLKGYLTIAGKESPKLSLWDLNFSGKTFFCVKDTKQEFEKYLNDIPGDTVDVTWLHKSSIPLDESAFGRRKKKKYQTPKIEQPKREAIDYNCTVQVSKKNALLIFDSSCETNINRINALAELTYDVMKRETISIDENIFLLFPVDSDIPNFVKFLKDREIYERTIMIPYPYTEEDGKKFVELAFKRHGEFGHTMDWGIHKRKEGLIGMIGFHGKSKQNPGIEEIGYWLGKPYWNQGMMTKALKKITELGFQKYNYKRIEMPIFSFNDASCHVAEKCGYKFEKLIPAAYQKDGKAVNVKLYAIEKS